MKYSSYQINNMSWQEWNETMAKELTAAGFKGRELVDGKWQDMGPVKADFEPEFFISSNVGNVDRLNYLKELGLINNGRCPMCGKKIDGTPGRYTNRFNPDYHYQICQNCAGTRGGLKRQASQSGGCMFVFMFIFVSILTAFFAI